MSLVVVQPCLHLKASVQWLILWPNSQAFLLPVKTYLHEGLFLNGCGFQLLSEWFSYHRVITILMVCRNRVQGIGWGWGGSRERTFRFLIGPLTKTNTITGQRIRPNHYVAISKHKKNDWAGESFLQKKQGKTNKEKRQKTSNDN